jgi:hypothetical protein
MIPRDWERSRELPKQPRKWLKSHEFVRSTKEFWQEAQQSVVATQGWQKYLEEIQQVRKQFEQIASISKLIEIPSDAEWNALYEKRAYRRPCCATPAWIYKAGSRPGSEAICQAKPECLPLRVGELILQQQVYRRCCGRERHERTLPRRSS